MPVKPPSFRPSSLPPPAQRAKTYERERGTARERGYDNAWDKASKRYRVLHPLCLGCDAAGLGPEPTTVVDHTIPHRGDQSLMWSEANWQPSCTAHHSIVKQHMEVLFGKGKASKADLRLDSDLAIAVTKELMR